MLDKGRENEERDEKKRGIKLEKNSVIKLGRVRFRVRDIDYADKKDFSPSLQLGTAHSASP